jgi:hypothetical protein
MGGNTSLSANSKKLKNFQVQQKARNILYVAIIAGPIVIGVMAYTFYQNSIAPNNSTEQLAQDIKDKEPVSPSPTTSTSSEATPAPSNPSSSETPTTPTPSSYNTTETPSSLQNNDIPSGVKKAINSIESDGIKGNSYVSSSLDTSTLPSDTTVEFKQSTWQKLGSDLGTIDAIISSSGQNYNISITFSLVSSKWKITGYSLNS